MTDGASSAFVRLDEIAPHRIWDGVVARCLPGERVTFAMIELGPDTVVPEHAHENEQIGVLLQGSLRFRIGSEERSLEAGEAWCVPGGVPHEVATGSEGALVAEVFAPARADWDRLERLEACAPAWPVPSGRL